MRVRRPVGNGGSRRFVPRSIRYPGSRFLSRPPPQPQEVDTGPLVTGDTRDGRSDRKYCDTGHPTHYDTGHPTHYDTGNGIPAYGYRMNNTTSEIVRRLMSGIRYPIAGIVVGPVSVIAVPLATVQRPEFDTGHPDPE